MSHESWSKKNALERGKALPVITHKKEPDSASSPGARRSQPNLENQQTNSKAEHASTSQDPFHNLDLNLTGIDSKLRTPGPTDDRGVATSDQKDANQGEGLGAETINSLTADRVDKKEMERMEIQVTVENQRGVTEEKEDFMRLKNQKLTNQDQDSNIRQVNINVLVGKQATYELRKQSAQ